MSCTDAKEVSKAGENSWESRPPGRSEGEALDEFLCKSISLSSFLSGGEPSPRSLHQTHSPVPLREACDVQEK